MKRLPVLVIRAAGINCDEETMHCWRLAGAEPHLAHVNTLADHPGMLDDFSIVTLPGGFSYGDDIAAGQILAQRLTQDLAEPMRQLVERGGGILGICNGFQALVKAGLLPGDLEPGRDGARTVSDAHRRLVTITFNDSARFEARWVRLEVCTDRCPFVRPDERRFLEMPVEHAEGRVVTRDKDALQQLQTSGRIAVRYVDVDGNTERYPGNPNGSTAGIAGLCDSTGRIFGLMPHPDRHFDHTHHPHWTRRNPTGPADGLTVFLNAVEHWRK
jgi:phosphoribosylformylglycinamidine synthase subunit PurQ / glutaminase